MGKGTQTKSRIMDIAQAAILEKGFGATSIEELIVEAGLTKSGFFYHFKDKSELAKALLERYIDQDENFFDQIFDRARELIEDPLQAFLVGLKMMAEAMADLPGGHPGCLVAVYCYQERLFDSRIRKMNRDGVLLWRRRFQTILEEIAERYPPREETDLETLADMLSTILEGGIVMSKALGESKVLADQIMMYRAHIKLLFLTNK